MSSDKIIPFDSSETKAQNNQSRYSSSNSTMNSDLVEEASKLIPDAPDLINMVSQRVAQLNMGRTPLLEEVPIGAGAADIALMEIIEGKVALDTEEESEE